MNGELQAIWVYLAASPLLTLTLTLLAYQGGLWLHAKSNHNALVNPVLVAMTVIVALLTLTGTQYSTYFQGRKDRCSQCCRGTGRTICVGRKRSQIW